MKKRVAAMALLLILVVSLCSGCKNKDNETGTPSKESDSSPAEQEISRAKYAYQATYLPLAAANGAELNYVNAFCVSGDYLFYVASFVTGTEKPVDPETGTPILDENTGEPLEYDVYEDGLFRMNLSSGQVDLLDGYQESEIPEGMEGDCYVQSMSAGTDGTFWMLEVTNTYYYDLPENFDESTDQIWNYYVEGDSYSEMNQYSSEGLKLRSVPIQLPENVYANNVLIDSSGRFYTTDWQNIYVFDENGGLTVTISGEDGIGELVRFSDDLIGVTSWNNDSTVFKPIDVETAGFGEDIKLMMGAYNVFPGFGEYQYLYYNGDSVYGVVEGADAGEKVISWLECDVDSNNIHHFEILADGRVAALEQIWDTDGYESNLVLLNQVDASQLPEKKELILGCMGLDWQIRPLIVDFNRSRSDVRITVKDYSESVTDEANYEDALKKLNTEIISGNAPDLLMLSGLPINQYAAKGVLLDLWPMIDADPEINREDLMEHLFDVMSVDGKLYQITNSFSVQTAAVRSSIAAGRTSWTLDEVLDALHDLQPGAAIFGETDTKTGILQQCLGFNLDTFIDWESGQCSFDSQEFISMLNFANSFPEEFDWESYDWETAESEYSRLMNGKQLMSTVYIGDFQELQVQPALHGSDVVYIGFPSENGTGSCFQPGSTISISANCSDVDAAWSFARELLLEENQTEQDVWSFPSNKSAFETRAKEKITPVYYTDPETGEQVEQSQGGIGYGNDFMIELYAVKQEEYEAFMSLYENTNVMYSYDNTIMNLIMAECEAFFAGQKTAEETARLIQNKLGLYVAEQM